LSAGKGQKAFLSLLFSACTTRSLHSMCRCRALEAIVRVLEQTLKIASGIACDRSRPITDHRSSVIARLVSSYRRVFRQASDVGFLRSDQVAPRIPHSRVWHNKVTREPSAHCCWTGPDDDASRLWVFGASHLYAFLSHLTAAHHVLKYRDSATLEELPQSSFPLLHGVTCTLSNYRRRHTERRNRAVHVMRS
jgi:hypothetical protein